MKPDFNYHGPVVALDLDDTLYPEADYVYSAYSAVAQALARRCSISPDSSLAIMQQAFLSGLNPFNQLFDAYPALNKDQDILSLVLEIYRYHTPSITLPPDSEKFLLALQAKGIKTAIITDGRASTQLNKIQALGLLKFIPPHLIFISEERGYDKTSPLPWRQIIRLFPEAKKFIAIGDNPEKDFLQPSLLGYKTIQLKDHGRNIHPQNKSLSGQASTQVDTLTEALPLILQ